MKTKLNLLEDETQFEYKNEWYIMISEVMPNVYGCFKIDENSNSVEDDEFVELSGNTTITLV